MMKSKSKKEKLCHTGMIALVPGFISRGGGTYIYKRIKDKEAGECKYCADKKRNTGCIHNNCPYLYERAALGTVDYKTFLKKKYLNHPSEMFYSRICELTKTYNGCMYLSDGHEYYFDRLLHKQRKKKLFKNTNILAAVYLLTSSPHLWNMVKENIRENHINFEKIKLKDISTDEYAIYQMAKTFCDSIPRVMYSELADRELVSDDAFKAIINAMLLKTFGVDVIGVFTEN